MTSTNDVKTDSQSQERVWSRSSRIIPSSNRELQKAEQDLMVNVKTPFASKYVDIGNNRKIWTYIFNKDGQDTIPLVMVHGFGGGAALWCLNLDGLAEARTVYAFDVLGFGRSSRYNFSDDSVKAEEEFVESIEDWREANGIERMILMGHSFGGYLVSSYALKYPDHIHHLVLADPWGFPEYLENDPNRRPIPIWIRAIARVIALGNPLAPIRCLGPFGPNVIKKVRRDLGEKFESAEMKKNAAMSYIYHCNAQKPSGERAFKHLTQKIGYAKNPMICRIGNLNADIPLSFMYGDQTWMDKSCGPKVKDTLQEGQTELYEIEDAGHHVYADQPERFLEIINFICDNPKSD